MEDEARTVGKHALKGSERSMEIWWILGFLALWLILQIWILPRLGVST